MLYGDVFLFYVSKWVIGAEWQYHNCKNQIIFKMYLKIHCGNLSPYYFCFLFLNYHDIVESQDS